MSFNGAKLFEQNLRKLMNSKTFKDGSVKQQLDLSYRLINTKQKQDKNNGHQRFH